MTQFSFVFLAFLLAGTGLRLWLSARHVRHVQAHRERVPEPFADRIDLEAHRKAADYASARSRLNTTALVTDALVLLILTLGGGFAAIADLVAPLGGLATGLAFVGVTVLVTSLVELPFNVYRTFGLEARFGFNKMTPAMFAGDLLRNAAVAVVLGLPLVLAVLWLMGRAGQWWWLWVWVVWSAFNLAVLAIYPTFVAPLFNRFSPMEPGDLRTRIEALLSRCGFRSQGLFVMDGSRRSSHGNAYFTGFGKSKRIVFFDTLLERLDHGQIEAVLAHELGHYRMNHVFRRMTITFVVSLVFLGALGALREASWFFQGLGLDAPVDDATALVVFFMVVPVFTFPLRPLMAMYSRRHEYEADAYAASNASAEDLAEALVRLYKDNASTLTPDPLHSAFYDSHPPAAARIARLKQLAAT